MNGIRMRVVVLPILIALLVPGNAWCCVCEYSEPIGPTPCTSYKGATAVFTGEVLSVFLVEEYEVEVSFAVIDWYKGGSGSTVTLRTGSQQSSCGVSFLKGSSYFVYASGPGNSLTTNACGRTLEFADAASDLEHAELAGKSTSASIEAEIRGPDLATYGYSGTRVELHGKHDTRTAQVSPQGLIAFYGLSSGEYRLRVRQSPSDHRFFNLRIPDMTLTVVEGECEQILIEGDR